MKGFFNRGVMVKMWVRVYNTLPRYTKADGYSRYVPTAMYLFASHLEAAVCSPHEARVADVVLAAHAHVHEVPQAVLAEHGRVPGRLDVEQLVVFDNEVVAHRLEVSGRHLGQQLGVGVGGNDGG